MIPDTKHQGVFGFRQEDYHSNTKKIEKIQERALRFIYSEYSSSYESLLIKFQLPSLKVRRLRTIALESLKILNNLSPAY